ncbi:MAG TPA: hypothetical protein VGR76_00410 [Candidatus Angelobacter sp.]|nr:hypothetical protein [Candidatus Angelobacter sp.]
MKAATTWIGAAQLPDAQYCQIHNWLCGIAGEGEPTTPEALGLNKRKFMHDRLFVVEHDLARDRHYDVVYSLSAEGELCFELFSQYHP